ncbi:MAG: hypothetical protein ACEQSE_02740 [Candidatus Aquirickettsiella gammari]
MMRIKSATGYVDPGHLPAFSYQFVQHGTHIFPIQRGLISTSHPDWYYILEPGRVWKETGDNGYLLGMCARFDQTGQTAVWGGFASKMGLASGPMIGSFLLVQNNYALLVWMAVILLVIATVASGIPAWRLDQSAKHLPPASDH